MTFKGLAASAITAAFLAVPVSPTWADEAADAVASTATVSSDVITATEITEAAETPTPKADKAEDSFIMDQAAQGVLLDTQDVDAAAIGEVDLAWSSNVALQEVEVATQELADGDTASELAMVADQAPTLTEDGAQPTMGSNALDDLEGVADSWGGAVTSRVSGDSLTNSWDLYRAKEATYNADRNYYYYGRYVIATGEQRDGDVDEYPMDIDLRSRPTEGTWDRVLTARHYYPFEGSSSCSSTSVGISIAQFGATLPISNCSSVTTTPDGRALRTQFDAGNCHDSRSEGLDLGLTFVADANLPRPAYSDYSYARFSSNKVGPCDMNEDNDVRVIQVDPGW